MTVSEALFSQKIEALASYEELDRPTIVFRCSGA